ncbi:MAG: C-GCAxxG-C-C family (seleno)protein [Ethanoligenens sp.]
MQSKEQLINEATNYYLGRNGHEKANCAQAVANTFAKEQHWDDMDLDSFRNYGGGRAPGGKCGAFYAAKAVLEKAGLSEKVEEIEAIFQEQAGALTCQEIRSSRKLPCMGCVEKATSFVCDCIGK